MGNKNFRIEIETALTKFDVKGTIGHAIQLYNSNIASSIIQDYMFGWPLTIETITHVVTQVNFEANQFERLIGYAPREYVGLLQNGVEWIIIRRFIDRGIVTWTYMRAKPAFILNKINGNNTASEVDTNACIEIARLIEHTYYVADSISAAILNTDNHRIDKNHIPPDPIVLQEESPQYPTESSDDEGQIHFTFINAPIGDGYNEENDSEDSFINEEEEVMCESSYIDVNAGTTTSDDVPIPFRMDDKNAPIFATNTATATTTLTSSSAMAIDPAILTTSTSIIIHQPPLKKLKRRHDEKAEETNNFKQQEDEEPHYVLPLTTKNVEKHTKYLRRCS